MITLDDIQVLRVDDLAEVGLYRKVVQYQDRIFSLMTQDQDPDNDEMVSRLIRIDPMLGMGLLFSDHKFTQTWVCEEKWDDNLQDWVPMYECDDTCDGVQCRKAVAKTHDVADASLAEKMLLDYLNA